METSTKILDVLLIGSIPLPSARESFTRASRALPNRLQQIPDGETGSRGNFIGWQHPTFPITIVQPRWGGQPSAESAAKTYTLEDIKPTGYDDQAIASYATFRELKAAGTIPSEVRFQVSLPTPLSVVRGFVEDDGVCEQVASSTYLRTVPYFRRADRANTTTYKYLAATTSLKLAIYCSRLYTLPLYYNIYRP